MTPLQQENQSYHKKKYMLETYNQFHNILRLFDVLPIFLSAQVKRWAIVTSKHGIYE